MNTEQTSKNIFTHKSYRDKWDLEFLICGVTSNKQFKWSYDFMTGSPLPYANKLWPVVASGIVVVEIKTFLICLMISKDHVFKGMWLYGWKALTVR